MFKRRLSQTVFSIESNSFAEMMWLGGYEFDENALG